MNKYKSNIPIDEYEVVQLPNGFFINQMNDQKDDIADDDDNDTDDDDDDDIYYGAKALTADFPVQKQAPPALPENELDYGINVDNEPKVIFAIPLI